MLKIEVNNKIIEAQENETVLSALKREKINVPTLCHMEGLEPTGACRLCMVELDDGRLIPSCSFPVYEGMKIKTHSPAAINARKVIVELLLADHPDDCLYCEASRTCELRSIAENLGIREKRFVGKGKNQPIDLSSPALVRDPNKCILCGKCVRVCEEIQEVSSIDFTKRGSATIIAPPFNTSLNISSCVSCGQCIKVCPTGALTENSRVKDVMNALQDPGKTVVVQHAPAVSVSLAEEFGLRPGTDVMGQMAAALRKMGFNYVFDTSFSADLTIMEEGSELVARIQNRGPLPLITSCSPAWIKFAETFYPEFLSHISTCKSPQQMLGALIKSYWAEKNHLAPENIYSVSIMPCTAKKFEAGRTEMGQEGISDVDAVLTTRELAKMIRMYGIDFADLEAEPNDQPFGVRSTAGKLFGASGGVTEAAIRSVHYLLTGKDPDELKVESARGLDGYKEIKCNIAGLEVIGVVVNGLGNARRILDEVKNGRKDVHFIEVMSCPGGCINGGGQPIGVDKENVAARMRALYTIDAEENLNASHHNQDVMNLYKEYLGSPNSPVAHKHLHTHYEKRDVLK